MSDACIFDYRLDLPFDLNAVLMLLCVLNLVATLSSANEWVSYEESYQVFYILVKQVYKTSVNFQLYLQRKEV